MKLGTFGNGLWTLVLTLWLALWPCASNAVAWQTHKTKQSVARLCDMEPEAWLQLYIELENQWFQKWKQIFVLYKVFDKEDSLENWWEWMDWWWFVMIPEKYSPKKHWKLKIYWYNSEIYGWNTPEIKKWVDWVVFMAREWMKIPATGEFYRVIVEDYSWTNKSKTNIQAGL